VSSLGSEIPILIAGAKNMTCWIRLCRNFAKFRSNRG